MKRELSLIVAAVVLGVYLGLAVFPLLWSATSPAAVSSLLTLDEKKGLEELQDRLGFLRYNLPLVKTLLVVLFVSAFVLLFLNLNRNLKRHLWGLKETRLKALAAFILFAGCFVLMAVLTEGMSYLGGARGAFKSILFVLLFGLAWYVAGETGWAADFSGPSKWLGLGAEPRRSILLGLAAGATAWALVLLGDRASAFYLALAAGVLADSPVPSWRGLIITSLGMAFMLAASLGVLAGTSIALAPVRRSPRERLMRLAFPAVLLTLYLTAMLAAYLNARMQYDLGKKDLAEAAGLRTGAAETLALMVLKPADEPSAFMLQRWPVKFSLYEGYVPGAVAATRENMERLEDYLFRRDRLAGRSVFEGQAHEALYRGYFILWDAERAMERLFASAERLLLARLLMIERLQFAPVTRENLHYLRAFADETRWHAGPEAALGLARGFAHFGMPDEARRWLARAGEGRGPVTDEEAAEAALTGGSIRGRITINGRAPAGAKLALFREHDMVRELDDFSLARWLIDARAPGESGFFEFGNLGEGRYFLALLAPEDTLPTDMHSQALSIHNPPGIIELSRDAPEADLGEIAVGFASQAPQAKRD